MIVIPQPIFDRLNFLANEKKSFDAEPSWKAVPNRMTQRLELVVGLRIGGVLRGGVAVRMQTPIDRWEEDLYGHIEVKIPGMTRQLRINPVEWRPLRYHDNPPDAPPVHRNQRLYDRIFPFDLNAAHGLQGFDQSGSGIAVPFPRAVESFSDYCSLCADMWKCPDLLGLAPPPWTRSIL